MNEEAIINLALKLWEIRKTEERCDYAPEQNPETPLNAYTAFHDNPSYPVRAITARPKSLQDEGITKMFKVPTWSHVEQLIRGCVINLKYLENILNVTIAIDFLSSDKVPCFMITGKTSAVNVVEKEMLEALEIIDYHLQKAY